MNLGSGTYWPVEPCWKQFHTEGTANHVGVSNSAQIWQLDVILGRSRKYVMEQDVGVERQRERNHVILHSMMHMSLIQQVYHYAFYYMTRTPKFLLYYIHYSKYFPEVLCIYIFKEKIVFFVYLLERGNQLFSDSCYI